MIIIESASPHPKVNLAIFQVPDPIGPTPSEK